MVRILCNLPLECFDERAALRGVELCTFGPRERMLVDGVHYPFDVAFDPATGSWDELAAALPRGFRPDFVLLWWPDQEPLPRGLEHCPVPVVGVVSDYNLTLPYVAGLWPFFDLLVCDRAGVDLFSRLGFAAVRWWCQYAHKRPFHRVFADAGPRDIDVGFCGNLNPAVQRERAPWIDRVRALATRGLAVDVRAGTHGADYGRFLNRCKLGFNRSIRGEMNLRAFEIPACGAVLLLERDNLEVREFFAPDAECVLYGDDDFEDVVASLLGDEPRRQRIAAAGLARVQQHRLGARLPALCELVATAARGRPAAAPGLAALGRATAMLTTWAPGEAIARAAVEACRLLPGDPRALNLLGLATLRWRGTDGGGTALDLWRKAATIAPAYVPAAANLAELFAATPHADLQAAARRELAARLARAPGFVDLDGPMLPLGFPARAVDRSLALQTAVRTGKPAVFAGAIGSPRGA